MKAMLADLGGLGVTPERIHYEFFGPASALA
ncbi:MAG: ferredoxin-NADP reductase [Myxococcota bacterium]|jgi:ferredoxin-NADP reductase